MQCLAVAFALTAQAGGGSTHADTRAAVQNALELLRNEDADATRAVYEDRFFSLLWVDDDGPTAQAGEVVAFLLAARDHGLNPEDYGADRLEVVRSELQQKDAIDPDVAARFDVDLTRALARLLSDLHLGRVPPASATLGRATASKRRTPNSLIAAVAAAKEPAARIIEVEPKLGVYARLKRALLHFRKLAAGPQPPALPKMPVLRPGDRHETVAALRRHLVATGDLPAREHEAGATDHYDAPIVQAVERFQRRAGLDVDGVVGRNTLRQLRAPLSQRIRQIELSLERLRWVPDDLAARAIIVNIPEFRLHGVHRGGREIEIQTDVVVGSAARRTQTPVLRAEMTYVVFRPYWNVPSSIARKELVPKERRRPGSLRGDNIEIVKSGGRSSSPLPPTEENLAAVASGALRLRQKPGPGNALGLVKFIFPNPSQVYLHDTPAKSLFGRSRRDFSHGCIRVADPVGLAEFVLGPQGWTKERIEKEMKGETPRTVHLEEPVSVLLFYTTAVVQGNGDVRFFDDIYGLDAALERRLRDRRPLGSAPSA